MKMSPPQYFSFITNDHIVLPLVWVTQPIQMGLLLDSEINHYISIFSIFFFKSQHMSSLSLDLKQGFKKFQLIYQLAEHKMF